MKHLVATEFDPITWPKYGTNWLRTAKSLGLRGFVFGDLSAEANDKIHELGFKLLSTDDKWTALAKAMEPKDSCLYTHCQVLPRLCDSVDAHTTDMSLLELVSSIHNLHDRAIVYECLKGKPIMSAEWVFGSWEFWTTLAGFQSYVYGREWLNQQRRHDELVLTLYSYLFGTDIAIQMLNVTKLSAPQNIPFFFNRATLEQRHRLEKTLEHFGVQSPHNKLLKESLLRLHEHVVNSDVCYLPTDSAGKALFQMYKYFESLGRDE
jgi:hypothetical protein